MKTEPTKEELKAMKLEVKQDLPVEERKRIAALIRRRAEYLHEDLQAIKDEGGRPTVSFVIKELGYSQSPKSIHLQIQKHWGEDYANTEATHKAKRKGKTLVRTEGQIDPEKTIKKASLTRSIQETPTLADIKKLKKMGKEKALAWTGKVASGRITTDILSKDQAQTILNEGP